jgi:uncharacterized protein YbjT (DUF2867 family)
VTDSERVLVAGASGRTGRRILGVLDGRDVTVRGLTTDRANVPALEARGADETVVGDLLVPADAARAVRGCTAVICVVGSGPMEFVPGRPLVDGEGGLTVAGSIPRADVARLLVASLSTPDARNRTFEVVSRDGLRGPARGLVDLDWQ